MYDILGSLVHSFLDTVSEVADVARRSGKRCPAAPLESCLPGVFAVCLSLVPGGDS